jgi:hypothetical protein
VDADLLVMILLVAITAAVAIPVMIRIRLRIEYRKRVAGYQTMFRRPPDGNDYRSTLIKVYERVRMKAQRYAFPLDEAETPRQFFKKAGDGLPVDQSSLEVIRIAHEWARYTEKDVQKKHLDAAIAAYKIIDRQLGKLEDELAKQGAMPDDGWKAEAVASAGRKLSKSEEGVASAGGFWVVAPRIQGSEVKRPALKLRPAGPAHDLDKGAVLEAFGEQVPPRDFCLPAELADTIKSLLAGGELVRLGEVLLERGEAAADYWRVHVDSSLVSYLLEFEHRAGENGLISMPTRPERRQKILKAAQVFSLAESRDYLVPDDLKIALYCAGPIVYGMEKGKIGYILDREERQVEFPKGPLFLMPDPYPVMGLAVPAV